MTKFGLIGEGPTDQITIENILCGYFEDEDLDGEIEYINPRFNKSSQKQIDFSNWTTVLSFLKTKKFRDDCINYNSIIVQIDTDVSNEIGFDVSHYDQNNQELTPEELIENIANKLISIINSGENNFYQYYSKRIIFAISVHSLECWFYAFYDQKQHNKSKSKPKIKGCFNALCRLPNLPKCQNSKTVEKNYDCYKILSQPFLKRENIDFVSQKDPSFRVFIQALKNIQI